MIEMYWHQHNAFYYKMATWKRKFSILPRYCHLTGQMIWFKHAMVGTRVITGPGEPVIETYWVDEAELLIHKLTYGYD